MNWYKVIKISQQKIPVGDVCQHIFNAIELQNSGEWEYGSKNLLPSYKDQKYIECELMGRGVVMPSDWFAVKILTFIRKAPDVVHPYNGTYDVTRGWDEPLMHPGISEEEIKFRWNALNSMKPMEVKEYDSETGNKLIKFIVSIRGDSSGEENRYEYISPIVVNEQLKTPYEIGLFVKNTINRFYFGGEGDDGADDNPIIPAPNVEIENKEFSYV